jgi:site-specific DNA recombinase
MERVAVYLRKSRADIEEEKKGEGETLTKHRKALFKFAQQQNLNVIEVYSEVKSAEKLIHRPEMQRLMDDVENSKYDAVLVMDIDRLVRGNMQEQGLIHSEHQKPRSSHLQKHMT